jgi:hypothetical protein
MAFGYIFPVGAPGLCNVAVLTVRRQGKFHVVQFNWRSFSSLYYETAARLDYGY